MMDEEKMMSSYIFPLAVAVIAIGSVILRFLLTARWSRTSANVISLGRPYCTGEDVVVATMVPIVRFSTKEGVIVTLQDKKLRLGPALDGERFDLLYCPHDPHKVVAVSFPKRFRIEILAWGISGFMVAAIFVS